MTSYSDIQFQLTLSAEQMRDGKPSDSLASLLEASRHIDTLEGNKFRSTAVHVWNAASNAIYALPNDKGIVRRAKLIQAEIEDASQARGEDLVFAPA